jgi:hypothetical protein
MKYQVSRNGRVIGDFSHEDIQHCLKEGSLALNDHYWTNGMPDWLPLSKLPKPKKEAPVIIKLKIPLITLGVIVCITLFYYLSARLSETREAEAAAKDKETKAFINARVQSIRNELKACEAFLADFELEGVGPPDKFDKSAPINPGTYRYKKPLGGDSPPATPDHKDLPRFDLVINMRGDGTTDLSVWGTTLNSLVQKYPLSGTGTKMQISVDGNVIDVGDVFVDEKFYNGLRNYSSFTSIDKKLSEIRDLVTRNKARPIYVRFTIERVGQVTAALHNEEERFQKYFELADILEKKKRLTEELMSHRGTK